MAKRSREEYYNSIKQRYFQASKKRKAKILDEYCKNCGYNRKYAIRKLNKVLRTVTLKPGRPREYDNDAIKQFLFETWEGSNYACSKRLKAMIPIWLPWYKQTLTKEQTSLLLRISAATIGRIFKRAAKRYYRKGISTTKPGSILKEFIPIKTNQWDETKPDFVETDMVAHCGSSIAGMFIYTVNMVDIATGWATQRAVWGKSETGVLEAIRNMERTLPFKILGFDCDNGSEFLNWNLLRYFKNRTNPVNYTRSREYHKNDNAHVESKNWTLVRQLLGYRRFDKPELLNLINALYSEQWYMFVNMFLPSVKLIEKIRIGSRIIKKHDSPKTPLQRMLESKIISKGTKKKLANQFKLYNPYSLKKEINNKIKNIITIANKSI
jgi:hypothetical protein